MKPSELFGVGVRIIGLLIILFGLYEVWGGLDNVIENVLATVQGDNGEQPSSLSFFMFGIPALTLGAVVFLFADGIVNLAYRKPVA